MSMSAAFMDVSIVGGRESASGDSFFLVFSYYGSQSGSGIESLKRGSTAKPRAVVSDKEAQGNKRHIISVTDKYAGEMCFEFLNESATVRPRNFPFVSLADCGRW